MANFLKILFCTILHELIWVFFGVGWTNCKACAILDELISISQKKKKKIRRIKKSFSIFCQVVAAILMLLFSTCGTRKRIY